MNREPPPTSSRTQAVTRAALPAPGYRLALLVIILLIASAFRFIGLDNFPTPRGATPPGLEHDEVAHWLINQDILSGEHAVYFTEAYGHEALYHYIQAYFGALVGDHALALRLPSAYFGVVLVAVGYALGRRLFGARAGIWSAAFLAVLLWPVFYSRLALRAISLPVFSGLAAYWWWRAFAERGKDDVDGRLPTADGRRQTTDHGRQRNFQSLLRSPALLLFLSGLLAGLSLHTYMAARAVPIFFAAYTLYLLLFHRGTFQQQWRGIALFWLALALVAAPLVLFLLTNPDAEVRIAEVDAPLRALLAGDPRPVLENAFRIAGMFGLRGDPLWRQNVAGRPVFDPVTAALFYAGAALALWRWRDKRHAFLVLWLAASVIPSLVTIDAPSSIRIINLLPVLMLFPLLVIHSLPHLSTYWEKLSTELITRLSSFLLLVLLFVSGWNTATGLWRVWPSNAEVRFVWQAALTETAAYLDVSATSGPVAVGGWTPETMDAPTMELSLRRDDLSLRYFDPEQGVLIPAAREGEPIRIIIPSALPLASPVDGMLAEWKRPMGEFTLYELPAQPVIAPQISSEAIFGDELRLLGYETVGPCVTGDPCRLVTYWQALDFANGPRRMFLHAVDELDRIVAQDDRLGAPAEHWQAGDVIIQLLTIPTTTNELRLGVYDPRDGRRLTRETGEGFVVLSDVTRP